MTALATDFPAVWNDHRTPPRERKRMLALLVEDVTLRRGEQITAHVRFRGGATTTLTLPLPVQFCDCRRTPAAIVAEAKLLLAEHTDAEVAAILDERGHTTGAGAAFDAAAVAWLRQRYQLPSLKESLRAAGGLTGRELAGISVDRVRSWARRGLLEASRCNDKHERIFAPIAKQPEPIQRIANAVVHATPAPGAV